MTTDEYFDPFAAGEILRVSPTTTPQQEIITSSKISDEANTAFNEAIVLHVTGALDIGLLETCFNKIIQRHDILRATFSPSGDTLLLQEEKNFKIDYEDLRSYEETEKVGAVNVLLKNISNSPLNLEEGPLFFVWVKQFGDESYRVIIATHHVICDGWSFGILLKELVGTYKNGGSATDLDTAASFFEFAEHQAAAAVVNMDTDYWLERFDQLPPTLDLPLDRPRPAIRSFSAARLDYFLNKTLVSNLPKAASKLKSSLVNYVLAGYFSLLYRLTGNQDIVVGLPVAGQAALNQMNLFGHMVQLIPIRMKFSGDTTFADLVKLVKKEVLNASEHPNFTFAQLLEKFTLDRSRVPLINTIFNIDQPNTILDFGTATATVRSVPRAAESFEIFLNIVPSKDDFLIEATYSTALFSKQTIDSWLHALEGILIECVKDHSQQIDSLILSTKPPEVVNAFNQTQMEICNDDLISGFSMQRERRPETIAAISDDQSLTYRKLDEIVSQFASYLYAEGIREGTIVGICCQRSTKLLISTLAVLKLGAAYLPLDPDFPPDRLVYMIEDSAAIAVIEDDKAPQGVLESNITHIDINVIDSLDGEPVSLPQLLPKANRLAYIIYTSGSTGKPKGVKVQNIAMINFLESMAKTPGFSEDDSLLAVTTLSFDISVLELFMPLIVGGKTVIVNSQDYKDGESLAKLILQHSISVMQATPSTWRMLLASSWAEKKDSRSTKFKALCGGEPLPPSLANELLPQVSELWNMYGPTETTVWSSCKQISRSDSIISIGPPIANTQIYILDANLNPLPVSVPGELCIGGTGVTLGYNNRPDLTADRFVNHPDFGRIYRTGDVAKVLPGGAIQHLGRMDDQVKLRGYRIELGEIETALMACPEVKRAAVYLWILGEEDVRIVACCIPANEQSLESSRIRDQLRTMLPKYMVPQHYLSIESIPLTPNGKIDRRSLPKPSSTESPMSGPALLLNDTEKSLAEIWSAFLKRGDNIDREDNFFELGGHSLLATHVISIIKKKFKFSITLRDFFEQPTIVGLAQLIDGAKQAPAVETHISIRKGGKSTTAPLSLQQRRLWFLNKLNGAGLEYNLPGRRRIRGPLDIDLFEKCINQIFQRHDVLRTYLRDLEFHTIQEILPQYEIKLPFIDLSHMNLGESESWYHDHLMEITNQPFDLSKAPLIKMHLYKLADEDFVFFFMPHHIIWDGWSFDIFHNELNLLYSAALKEESAQLPELPVQYGDYAQWQSEWIDSGAVEKQVAYWKEKLGGALPVLELNTDNPRPAILTYENGTTAYFNIERRLTDKLTEDAHKTGATLFMALLAAYKILLHTFTGGQRDIIVGSPISGRNSPEISNLLGFFVNTLIMRSEVDPNMSYNNFLKQLKITCLNAFNNQDTPFERIVEVLNPVRDLSRAPIFQTMFAYQDVRNRKKIFAGMPYEQINIARPSPQTDIDYWVRLSDEGITGGFDYNQDLFKNSTIKRVVKHYLEIIKRIVENPNAKIVDLIAVPLDEYQLQVRDWNNTAMDYPKDKCVHELFSINASQNGQQTAIVFNDQKTNYAELEKNSDFLSRYLIKLGVRCGDLVGIHMERCTEMVIAMLGILKSGAGYVPLDPEYPSERIQYMMKDAGIKILLTQSHLNPPIQEGNVQPIYLDTQWENIAAVAKDDSSDMPPPEWTPPGPENIAYVIYTSGSTGKPKGVEVPHRALVNFLVTMSQKPGISKSDTLLAVTTLSFDIAGLEIFLPLLFGAKIVLADREAVTDGGELLNLMEQKGITMMQATPSTWRMLLVAGWQGNKRLKILCGGEAFPKDLARTLVDKCGEVWNMYGPTETTIWSTCHQIKDVDGPMLIGKPIGNTQAFVLDGNMQPVPIGVPGELYLGGDGVTLGYHMRPDLTKNAFVQSPFVSEFERLTIYKTGDLCRYHADGNLEYLNRIDTQVKVRGFRIELGEIESRLEQHDSVKQAIAIVKEFAPGDARLAAYIVPNDQLEIIGTEMRKHLRKNLPDYMIPQHFIESLSLPLTPAGKVDRKKLTSQFEIGGREVEKINPPSSESEKYLATVWGEILRISEISTHHNFFNIGGHSLLAMQVIARIAKDTGVKISPRDMLLSTLEQVANKYQPKENDQTIGTNSSGGLLHKIINKLKQ